MSLYDYKVSREIEAKDYPFYALIMAAMRQADDINLAWLKKGFPDIYSELKARYSAPGGLLTGESNG
jgi:hypothetical protein